MVAAAMRNRFEEFGKQMVRAALETRGLVETDVEVSFETWRRAAIQEGVEQGLEKGVARGVARSLIDIYEARFGAMPEDVRAVVEDMHDEPLLRGWVKLAGTRGADEVAAAIRACRTS